MIRCTKLMRGKLILISGMLVWMLCLLFLCLGNKTYAGKKRNVKVAFLDKGLPVVTISCNFSRLHFIKPDFPQHFMKVLHRYQIPKELIEIEITETLVMEELQQHRVKKTLDILKENGIRLSIDDFGAGYSSLGVIEQIPASVIKLCVKV